MGNQGKPWETMGNHGKPSVLELRVAMGLLVVGNELLPQRSKTNTQQNEHCKNFKEKRTRNQTRNQCGRLWLSVSRVDVH